MMWRAGDAKLLSKDLFTKSYSQFHVSSRNEEAIKEFCRMRQPPEERIEKSQAGVERRLEEIAKDGEVKEKVEKLVFF